MKFKIKKGDTVLVNTGSNKGSKGKVLQILYSKQRVVLEGVNMLSKHLKPSANKPQGGIEKKEGSVHISNVSLIDSTGNTTKVGYRFNEKGKKERYSKNTNEVL